VLVDPTEKVKSETRKEEELSMRKQYPSERKYEQYSVEFGRTLIHAS
jgi:hypothetical protein